MRIIQRSLWAWTAAWLFVLGAVVVGPAQADRLARSIVSAGAANSAAFPVRVRATLGQPAVGLVGDLSTRHHAGFWHRRTGATYFAGTAHAALGEASLELGAQGQLVVSGFGSSGQDGVAIDIGRPEATRVDLSDALFADGLSDGVQFAIHALGGSPLVPAGFVSGIDIGSEFETTPDFSDLGSFTATVQVLNGPIVVARITEFTGSVLAPGLGAGVAMGVVGGEVCIMQMWNEPQPITIPGFGTVLGDQLQHVSEIQGIVGPMFLGEMRLFGADLPSLQISGVALKHFGQFHTGLGNALLDVGPEIIALSNLGESGEDGVRVELSGAKVFGVDWSPLNDRAGPGDRIELRAEGLVDGTPAALGHVWMDVSAANSSFSADFSALETAAVRVQVLLGEQPVAALQGAGIAAAWSSELPTGALVNVVDYGQRPFAGFRWTAPVEITLAGLQAPFIGDQVRFEAFDAGVTPDAIQTLDIRSSGVSELSLLQENPAVPVGPGLGPPSSARTVLHPNVPNPFNPSTQLSFSLAHPGRVRLDLYTLRGRHLRNLLDEDRPSGSWAGTWDGTDAEGRSVATGVYLVRLSTPGGVQTRKVALLK